jgi:hypothetical protein
MDNRTVSRSLLLVFRPPFRRRVLSWRNSWSWMGRRATVQTDRFAFAKHSSAWLERLLWEQEFAGPNPVAPISSDEHRPQ